MKNNFKIIISLAMALCLVFLSGCKGKEKGKANSNTQSAPVEVVVKEAPADDTKDPENIEENVIGNQISAEELVVKTGKANGIDVSKWQGKIDWKAVKNSGIDFAIIRIGYRGENGLIYRDDNGDYNIQQAQKAGVLVGVYFFSTAINTAEAIEEANFVINAVKGYKISYPVVYDCEGYTKTSSRMYSLTAAQRTSNAKAFLNKVKSTGYDPMFYGAKSELENSKYWDIHQIENSFKVWVAHYSSPAYPTVETPNYSGKYDMWQYTNRGSVNGVQGNCDMVVAYFTNKEAAAKDSNATPDEATAPKTQEELLYTDVSDSVTAKDIVNLRQGPSTKYNAVATLKSGEFLKRTGIGKNGWSRLLYNGTTVYAITSYLTDKVVETTKEDIVNGIRFTPFSDKVTAKDEVNLRSAPSTDSQVVGKLVSGTFLERTAKGDNGWSRLNFNGSVVYAVTSYLTNTVTEISEQKKPENTFTEHAMVFTAVSVNVTAKEQTNLRDKPSTTDSNIIYTLKNGEYIKKVGVSNSGWAKLEYNGQAVYAIDSYLTE